MQYSLIFKFCSLFVALFMNFLLNANPYVNNNKRKSCTKWLMSIKKNVKIGNKKIKMTKDKINLNIGNQLVLVQVKDVHFFFYTVSV